MVVMSTKLTFDETLHPRGQASNGGQFRAKLIMPPAGALIPDFEDGPSALLVSAGKRGALDAMQGEPQRSGEAVFAYLVGRAVEAEDRDTVSEIASAYETAFSTALPGSHPIDVAVLLTRYEKAKSDYIGTINENDTDEVAFEEHEDSMMGLVDDMAIALRRQLASDSAPVPGYQQQINEWTELLADVNTMGGDEIRALDDDTLLRLDEYLLTAASRVQAARGERGLMHKDSGAVSAAHLEVLDFRNVSEEQFDKVWVAASTQHEMAGVARNKTDFFSTIEQEHEDATTEQKEEAWANFVKSGLLTDHAELPWAERESNSWWHIVNSAYRQVAG